LEEDYTYYRISKANIQRMKTLKQSYNFRSYDGLISFLINSLSASDYPSATPQLVMENTVPVILTGIPGSGKTTFLRERLIPKLDVQTSLFVLDVHSEYPSLEQIDLGKFYSLDFASENRKLRFLTSSNPEIARSEADSIFRHMIMMQKALSRWVVIIEEGHRFVRSTALRSLLAEGRKHILKLIVVAHQVESYRGLGIILKVTSGIS
jgi:hypothetical protein